VDDLEERFYQADTKDRIFILKEIEQMNVESYIDFLESCIDDDKSRRVRKTAANILDNLENKLAPDLKYVDDYVEMLCDTNNEKLNGPLNQKGQFCLERLGEDAIPKLLKYLNDEKRALPVLNVLTNIAEERIIPLLISIYPIVNDTCKMVLLERIAFLDTTGNKDFLLQCTQNENEVIRKRARALYLTALKKSAHTMMQNGGNKE